MGNIKKKHKNTRMKIAIVASLMLVANAVKLTESSAAANLLEDIPMEVALQGDSTPQELLQSGLEDPEAAWSRAGAKFYTGRGWNRSTRSYYPCTPLRPHEITCRVSPASESICECRWLQ